MSKIFFLTECDPDLKTGGAIIRRGTIDNLRRLGFQVVVVKPGAVSSQVDSQTYTISGFATTKMYYAMEALGLVADKYFLWSHNVYNYLKNIINKDDIIFATTGGALSAVIAGVRLKKKTGAKLLVNYHDPTDFTSLGNGFSRHSRFYHVNRDGIEKKLIPYMDYIVTSSEAYKEVLLSKYPAIKSRIECNYFGYIKSSNFIKNRYNKVPDTINIVYGGNMGPTQAPEILAEAVVGLDKVKATFIGNYKANSRLLDFRNAPNIQFVDQLSIDEYFKYCCEYADIGFFSLRNNLTNYCVPSKLFDYINVGLPMVAVVGGDARSIIIDNHYGLVSNDSPSELQSIILKLAENGTFVSCQNNVINDRNIWSMTYRIEQLKEILNKLMV